MNPVIQIDGVSYQVRVLSITRKAKIRETSLSGDVKSGRRFRDIIGTYYDYEVEFGCNALSSADYDALYDVLTAPVESHQVTLPYGDIDYTFDAYITSADDTMVHMTASERRWRNLQVAFYALEPKRRPV